MRLMTTPAQNDETGPPPVRRGLGERAAAGLTAAWILFCLAAPLSIAGANIGWGLVAAALLAMAWSGEPADLRQSRSPLLAPVLLYCAAALAASLAGTEPAYSLRELHKELHKAWLCALFGVGLAALPRESEGRLAAALGASFAAGAALGIGQTAFSLLTEGTWRRGHGFVHPVTYGEIMVLGILGILACLLKPPRFLESATRRRWAWGLLALTAAAACLSQTRGALLGLAAGAALWCLPLPRLRKAVLAGAAAALLALSALDLMPEGRSFIADVVHRARGEQVATPQLARLALWSAAWRMFQDHPWTGVGPNNYRANYRLYHSGPGDIGRSIGSAHNLFLHHMAERGLAGLAALAALFGVLWWRSYQRARIRPDAWNLWAFGATAAFTAMNLTEVALEVEQVWILFFFLWLWAEKRHLLREDG